MTETNMLFATEEQQNQIEESAGIETAVKKYLVFRSDALLFGVAAEYVLEIITNYSITRMPMVPDYVRGIINLRGQIVPIVDIRRLMGKPSKKDDCIIVLNIDGTEIGILVDSVVQIVDVPEDGILAMPGNNAQKLIAGMCSLPDGSGTMMVLDCPMLLRE